MTQDYYGTKRVTAWPEQKRQTLQEGTAGTDPDYIWNDGYAVKYADGYVSWSPKEVFEAAYKPITAMGFEGALAAMKAGHKVRRAVDEQVIHIIDGKIEVFNSDKPPGYFTDQTPDEDVLAEDWMIVE